MIETHYPKRLIVHAGPKGRGSSRCAGLLMAAFGLICAVALLVAAEYAYRGIRLASWQMPPAMWVVDDELLYKLNPENPQFPEGFRGKAPVGRRDPGYRIICMGGSTTFAEGVEEPQA